MLGHCNFDDQVVPKWLEALRDAFVVVVAFFGVLITFFLLFCARLAIHASKSSAAC